jgi:hypothetical protein
MKLHGIAAVTAIGAVTLLTDAGAQEASPEDLGVAVVTVEVVPPGAQGRFKFAGTPEGVTAAGGSISQAGVAPGEYTTVEVDAPRDLDLVSITCDDTDSGAPSRGEIESRRATLHIEPRETVTCVFLYRAAGLAEDSSTAPPGVPGGTPSAESVGCEAPALVPRAGSWDVSNFAGRMVCGSMINMPLRPSQANGVLEIRDCGWTVVGTGLAEDTAPLTMHAVDASSGRYTGSVGGVQDGIPMTIDFTWQLNSEESIVGDLSSEVTQQGMTCRMSRTFELKYAGS